MGKKKGAKAQKAGTTTAPTTSAKKAGLTPTDDSQPFYSLSNINSYTDEDLDALLNKASSVLAHRNAQEEAERKRAEEEAKQSGGAPQKKDDRVSLLKTILLDPKTKPSEYLLQTSEKGAVRLNPAKFEIVETKRDVSGGSSQNVTKGLGKGDSKGLLDRIVVTKPVNAVAPELDHDDKKKKKMVVETAGPKWFNMPAPDLTDKLKLEVQIIKARNVLDPKHHYKRADPNAPKYPKFFQMGTVIEGATEFHSARIAKRDRRDGLVEEVLADDKTKTYLKRKFGEIRERNEARGRRASSKKKRFSPASSAKRR
ncbi:Fcf2-domain-containing protein [Rhizoclosmatium globosum]|uniref:Fcf2-domain-containing protein n=1 Tax=Rhizoclosmatium globosum TaxID=329046 RepID=A0A1Y2D1N9_9FUNG|nr:Fcf2-domain-containing protein [Rhizoclosmatium globosum]|eukprot:ORY53198.1 Fcf2-domain-containing protein [Rhizoclosmatium globosum]